MQSRVPAGLPMESAPSVQTGPRGGGEEQGYHVMEDRRVEMREGYVLLDALFTLFLSTVVLLSVLGLVSLIAKRAAQAETLVREEIQERNDYAREREVIFISE